MSQLVLPQYSNPLEGYEQPVDPLADSLAAAGFYPQYSGTPDANVGIERDVNGNLILKDTVSGTFALGDLVGGGGAESPLVLTSNGIAEIPLTVVGYAGQTGHLQDWSDSTPTVKAYVDANGAFYGRQVDATDGYGFSLAGVAVLYTGSGSTTLKGKQANGASSINLLINSPAYSTAGAKLLSIQNNSSEKANVDLYGHAVFAAGNVILNSTGIYHTNGLFSRGGSGGTATFQGTVADGASAVGIIFNNSQTLSTSGAKLISITNNGVEKASFSKDGYLTIGGSQYNSGSIGLNGSISGLYSVSGSTSFDLTITGMSQDFVTSNYGQNNIRLLHYYSMPNSDMGLAAFWSRSRPGGVHTEALRVNQKGGLVASTPDVATSSRTNYALYSTALDNAAWVASGLTKGALVAGPNGSAAAGSGAVTLTVGATTQYLYQNITGLTQGVSYTLSFYVMKSATTGTFRIWRRDGGAFTNVTTTAGNFTVDTSWQRIAVRFVAGATNDVGFGYDGTNGITTGTYYIWGAQVEAGDFTTPLIATTNASASVTDQYPSAALTIGNRFALTQTGMNIVEFYNDYNITKRAWITKDGAYGMAAGGYTHTIVPNNSVLDFPSSNTIYFGNGGLADVKFYQWQAGTSPTAGYSARVLGTVATGASAVGFRVGNTQALSTTGAKIISFYSDNFSTERAFFDYLGNLTVGSGSGTATLTVGNSTFVNAGQGLLIGPQYGVFGVGGQVLAYSFRAYGGTGTVFVTGTMADGASAIGAAIDNTQALANAGAKILSIRNATVEKAYFDKDGLLYSGGVKTVLESRTINGYALSSNITLGAYDVGADRLAGFENRTDSTISFVDGTRTFTVAPAATTFSFWTNNVKYTKNSAQTVVIPNTIGQHYIYFDASGTLVSSTSAWDISSDQIATVATVYWSGTSGAIGDERHNMARSRSTHVYLHSTRGTAYDSGFTGTYTNTTFSVTTGIIYDEDIRLSWTGPFTTCKLWYRNASSQMLFTAGSVNAYAVNAGALRYDNAGTLTDVSNNSYVMNWVYATNDPVHPVYVVVGQSQQNNLANARASAMPVFPNLSTREWKLLYSVLYRNSGGTPTFIESVDFRSASSLPGASVSSLPAVNVVFTPSGTLSSLNVQAALEELDGDIAALSVSPYTLPAATDTVLGGVKGFSNLTIDVAGALSLSGANVLAALGYTPWHAGNDGAGSGLDADTLDGHDTSYFQTALGFTAVPNTRTVNGHALSGDISVVASEVPFTPVGTLTSTDVQTALAELDSTVSGLSGASSPLVLTAAVAAEQPLRIIAHASQSVDLFSVELSAGGKLFWIDSWVNVQGGLRIQGVVPGSYNGVLYAGAVEATSAVILRTSGSASEFAAAAWIDTNSTWATSGAKLLQLSTGSNLKAFITIGGGYSISGSESGSVIEVGFYRDGSGNLVLKDGTSTKLLSELGGSSYTLPVAAATTLGGVKGFTNLTIDGVGALSLTGANVTAALGYTPWHSGNDGTGSGLDADLLDGQSSAYFLDLANATGTLAAARFDDTSHGARGGGSLHANVVAGGAAGFMSGTDKTKLDGISAGAGPTDTAAQILTKLLTVDGAGSGLDADLLDGQSSAYYATTSALAGYMPLTGATIAAAVALVKNNTLGNSLFNSGHIELRTTDNSVPSIGFHRSGTDAAALYFASASNFRIRTNGGGDYLFAHDGISHVPNADVSLNLGSAAARWNNVYLLAVRDSAGYGRFQITAASANYYLDGYAAPSAGSVGHIFDTVGAYPSGAKLISIRSATSEKAYFDYAGGLTAPGLTITGTSAFTGIATFSSGAIPGTASGGLIQVKGPATSGQDRLLHMNTNNASVRGEFVLSNSQGSDWVNNFFSMMVNGTTVGTSYYGGTSDNGKALLLAQGSNITSFHIGGYHNFAVDIMQNNVVRLDLSTTGVMSLKPGVANGSSAVALIVDNTASLSTSGAKIVSVRNNTTEKSFFDKDGGLGIVGTNDGAAIAVGVYRDTSNNAVVKDGNFTKKLAQIAVPYQLTLSALGALNAVSSFFIGIGPTTSNTAELYFRLPVGAKLVRVTASCNSSGGNSSSIAMAIRKNGSTQTTVSWNSTNAAYSSNDTVPSAVTYASGELFSCQVSVTSVSGAPPQNLNVTFWFEDTN